MREYLYQKYFSFLMKSTYKIILKTYGQKYALIYLDVMVGIPTVFIQDKLEENALNLEIEEIYKQASDPIE